MNEVFLVCLSIIQSIGFLCIYLMYSNLKSKHKNLVINYCRLLESNNGLGIENNLLKQDLLNHDKNIVYDKNVVNLNNWKNNNR